MLTLTQTHNKSINPSMVKFSENTIVWYLTHSELQCKTMCHNLMGV